MEPVRADQSDSDISDDWNVVEAKETFTASLSESESIEVIGSDDIDSAVSAEEGDCAREEESVGKKAENSPLRPLVTDEETSNANESVASSEEPPSRSESSTLTARPLVERGMELRSPLNSLSLHTPSNSTLLFISNQMFAFLMLLVAVSLSYTGGRGAFSTLVNLGSYPLMADDFTAEEYPSQSENIGECSKRLTQAEKKIENIRLAAQSLEDGTMSLPVFMDFIKDIGRPAYVKIKTKSHNEEVIDFASPGKKFQADKVPRAAEKRSNNFEENVDKFQDRGNARDKRVQYSRKFEGKVLKDSGKFGDGNSRQFEGRVLQGPGKLDGNSRKFDARGLQESGNGDSIEFDGNFAGKYLFNANVDELEYSVNFGWGNIGESSQFERQNLKEETIHLKNKIFYSNQSLVYRMSLVLKNSPQAELQQLGKALLNMTKHLAENNEKIAEMSVERDNKYIRSMLEKFSTISNKIDQQVSDFFKRMVEKFSKNVEKIGEQVRKLYCDGKVENCQKYVKENGGELRGERRFDKNGEQKLKNREKLDYGKNVGRVEIGDEKRIDENNGENYRGKKSEEKKEWKEKNNEKFAKNKRRELGDELSGGRNFDKGEKRKDSKEEEKFKNKKKEYKGDKKQKDYDENNKDLHERNRKNSEKYSKISDISLENRGENTVNEEFKLKKNFVEMKFEGVEDNSDKLENAYKRLENVGDKLGYKPSQINEDNSFDKTESTKRFLANEIEANLKQRENLNSDTIERFEQGDEGGDDQVVEKGGEGELKEGKERKEDLKLYENEKSEKIAYKQFTNDRIITDDFFYAVSKDSMKESYDDDLNKDINNVLKKDIDSSNFDFHDHDFELDFGEHDSRTSYTSREKLLKKGVFDKFTKKDIQKLKKQILRTTRQNVEKLFDSFVSSLMEDLGGNTKENFTKTVDKTSDSISDWFLLMGDKRSEIRKINSQSDWLFDRAYNRRKWHEKRGRGGREGEEEEGAEWMFRRALERQKCRENPNSWECRRYSMKNFRYNSRESFLRGKNVSPNS
ncbi:hypothetical protein LSTR_LSTR005722 [Laodelphax striatellus]|uniref:Uncharacterized protein n=1 Tax=Laodelphax striatellus TaxID=195883 RepID=A0A482XJ25_LAOST|nr:hypothetical protein LSTR_LSTR005722 [Laodelphax striatellus]